MKGKKKEVTTISQRAAQIVEGACNKESEDVACPRCVREPHVFNTASGPILRGWILAGTPCTADQSMPQWSHNPWRVAEYQPYRRWKFSEWFWWPRNTSKTRTMEIPGSTSFKRLDSPGASRGHRNNSLSGKFSNNSVSISQYQQQLVAASTTDPWQVLPEDDGSIGDRWSMDTGTDPIGV